MLRDYFSMSRRSHPRRVAVLMISTIIFIALLPISAHIPRLVDTVQVIMIVSAISVAGIARRSLYIGAVLGIPAALLSFAADHARVSAINYLSYAFSVILYIYMLILMLRRIFLTQKVTKETIFLGITSYLMMGLTWTLLYVAVEVWNPGSFTFGAGRPPEVFWVDLYYFSYVTLTTLGYGDVSPIAPVARVLAIFEAMTGVLYLGILMARLIGAYEADMDQQLDGTAATFKQRRRALFRSIDRGQRG